MEILVGRRVSLFEISRNKKKENRRIVIPIEEVDICIYNAGNAQIRMIPSL